MMCGSPFAAAQMIGVSPNYIYLSVPHRTLYWTTNIVLGSDIGMMVNEQRQRFCVLTGRS